MPEFLTLLPPADARELLFSRLPQAEPRSEIIQVDSSLNRVAAEDMAAPHQLPEFPRSTVDGYAVRARDTHGASDSQPGYLKLVGEVMMGAEPAFEITVGQCGLIHTGGMLPAGADAVVMLEYTQLAGADEVEILRAAAEGEGIISVGEDARAGDTILKRGQVLGPAEIGGLLAMGITSLRVVTKPRVGIISSGDEVVEAHHSPRRGQVRDVNSHTLAALVAASAGEPVPFGIVRDDFAALAAASTSALEACDLLVISAGSSASTRDMTAEVIDSLGEPGVLVHGINTRPGKPTILAVCNGKAVIGLPGNPVSALVNGYLFVVPVIDRITGRLPAPRATVRARLSVNLASQAGREDWWPVKLVRHAGVESARGETSDTWIAEPVFSKSNLILSLAAADGLLMIAADSTGMEAGAQVEVSLI